MNTRSKQAAIVFALGCLAFIAITAFASQAEGQSKSPNMTISAKVIGQSSPVAYFKAESSGDAELDLAEGKPFVLSLKAENSTVCMLYVNDKFVSGVPCSYESAPIESNHPWYPAKGSSVDIAFKAKNDASEKVNRVKLVRKL